MHHPTFIWLCWYFPERRSHALIPRCTNFTFCAGPWTLLSIPERTSTCRTVSLIHHRTGTVESIQSISWRHCEVWGRHITTEHGLPAVYSRYCRKNAGMVTALWRYSSQPRKRHGLPQSKTGLSTSWPSPKCWDTDMCYHAQFEKNNFYKTSWVSRKM